MNLRLKVADISSIQGRKLFFDANVLLYLFGGVTPPMWANDEYSKIFKQCKSMGNILCVDVSIL